MSKSLGNFFTLRDVLKEYRAEEIRYFILGSHYRSPLNYSEEQLELARSALTRLYTALLDAPFSSDDLPAESEYMARFDAAMCDDFNTADALAVLFDLTRELNRAKAEGTPNVAALAAQLKHLAGIIGLLEAEPADFLKSAVHDGDLSDEEIDARVEQRAQAKRDKNWALADRIRDELAAAGVTLEDGAGGTRWRRA